MPYGYKPPNSGRDKPPTSDQVRERARAAQVRLSQVRTQKNKAKQRVDSLRVATGSGPDRAAQRDQRTKALARLRTLQAGEQAWIKTGRERGLDDRALGVRGGGRGAQAPGVTSGTGQGGGSTPASGAPAVGGGSGGSGGASSGGGGKGKGTRAVTPRKRDYTVDAKNAKKGTVLKKALKMYGDPRKDPSKTGEMLQDGAKSPHHVTLSGKEFQSFKKKYIATHKKAGGANLSDWSLRAMARMLKGKNSEAIRKTYGFGEHKPPSAEG